MKPPERRWRTSTEWGPTVAELKILTFVAYLAGVVIGFAGGCWWCS